MSTRYCDHVGFDCVLVEDKCVQPRRRTVEDLDLHQPRARRYAEALAAAAQAEARIKTLVEILAEHEWHRSQAEQQLDGLRELLNLNGNALIVSTDEEPDDNVRALLDLYGGTVWVRPRNYDGSGRAGSWVKADSTESGQTQYEWPIQDAGPFVALGDGWHLEHINATARKRDEQERRIREALRNRPGYYPEGVRTLSDLDVAVNDVLGAIDQRYNATYAELSTAKADVHRLANLLTTANQEIAELKDDDLLDDGREGDDR